MSESTHLEALEALIRERLEAAGIPVQVRPIATSAEASCGRRPDLRAYLNGAYSLELSQAMEEAAMAFRESLPHENWTPLDVDLNQPITYDGLGCYE